MGGDLVQDGARRLGIGEIGGEHHNLDPVAEADLVGQLAQAALAPGREDQVVAVPGVEASEGGADTGRGAGDQGQACAHAGIL